MSQTLTLRIHDLTDTDSLGAALAELLPEGATVSLSGTLGAGKTRLVQALAAACGIERSHVVSPTFVLCQHYHGTRTIHHLDAYRVKDDDEFLELGVDEMFSSGSLTIIEWGERVSACLPADRIEIMMRVTGDSTRLVDFVSRTPRHAPFLTALRTRLSEKVV